MVCGDVVNAVRRHLAEFRDLEIVHPYRFRISGTAQLATGILEVPDEFFLLRVHRDRRLAGTDRRLHRAVDVVELRIAIRVLATFPGLAVALAAVVQLAQQIGHHPLAGLEALLGQRLDQIAQAAADPAKWRTGIAANGVLDQGFEGCRQAWLVFDRTLASATRTANA